jgi:hypothetical protein
MNNSNQKYPRGKAELSSFEESEFEQRVRWAQMSIMERFENCLRMMDLHGSSKNKLDESGNEFLLSK